MIDYETAGEMSDHLIPKCECDNHAPFDFCDCRPVMKPWMGRWYWVHNVSPEQALLEDAEDIRKVVSVKLWKDIEGKNIAHQIIPFQEGDTKAIWPKPADKHGRRN